MGKREGGITPITHHWQRFTHTVCTYVYSVCTGVDHSACTCMYMLDLCTMPAPYSAPSALHTLSVRNCYCHPYTWLLFTHTHTHTQTHNQYIFLSYTSVHVCLCVCMSMCILCAYVECVCLHAPTGTRSSGAST